MFKQLEKEVETCKFVGEFPSAATIIETSHFSRSGSAHLYGTDTIKENEADITVDTLCKIVLKTQNLLRDLMKLHKKIASEAIVFSLADTDRTWKREIGHGMPIGYLFKGYSLRSDSM